MPVEPPRRLKLLQQQQVFPRLLGLQIAGSGRAKLNLKLQQQAVHGRPRPMRWFLLLEQQTLARLLRPMNPKL